MTLVRAAAPVDVADVAALEALAFPLDPWSPTLLEQAVDGTVPTVRILVAERDTGFAGYAVVSVVDVDAELQRIAVPEDLRRTGVAGALLDAVHVHAASLGARRLLLEVREDNLSARMFYTRHGFDELGRRARYYRDGATALVLSTPVRMDP
ncbi:ribosomal protein S18-alanine N-acetyltransferase [Nocardioides sp. LML1-1-1.1]|uniref:ribosomal protein S18-alanine N-acetyltransferase n=1 Tax=Nocardioides sp. LML1-1-1.1 TaxID=3135248 RepID=UPI003413FBEF